MSTFGILHIHNVIKTHKGNYCCICFRPAVEVKLVEPVHFLNFLSKLTNAGGLKGKIYKVCYICEGLALSAVRFIRAVELASRVSELYSSMNQGQLIDVIKYVTSPAHIIPKNKAVCDKALELEKSLRSSPRYELRRTDTLVVPSPPRPRQGIQPETIIPTAIPPLTSVIQVPVAPPAPAPVAPPTSVLSLRKQTEVAVDPNLNVVRVTNKDTNQIILHPMVTGSDGNIYVPSLQVQLLDNGILKSAPNIQNVLPPPSPTPPQSDLTQQITKETTVEKRKTDKNKEKSDYYKFLVSQMEQKQSQNAYVEVIKMNDMNIVLEGDGAKKRRKRSEGDVDRTLSDVQLLLNENANGGCEIKYEIIDDDDENVVKDGKESGSKGPLEKSDRTVDWEDKIPMDVISFMDATDPNPEERIMQPPPMGVISDVRSVPSEPIECIDLC